MQDIPQQDAPSMKSLGRDDWLAALERRVGSDGFCEALGKRHDAAFTPGGDVLLVTFETRQGIQALSSDGAPLGGSIASAEDWAHLGLICEGETWFRDRAVYAFFDRMTDDGFFDDYDRVVFYGAGPCGYAAAAFSVAAPGATIVAIQPQATLDPRMAGWDERFFDHRHLDFTTRYGYAPDMLDAAERAFVIFDPREGLDAMHAALFRAPNVTLLRAPLMGGVLQSAFLDMGLLPRLIARAGKAELSPPWFHAVLRGRRSYKPYLRGLVALLERDGRDRLAEMVCRNVTERMEAPRFRRKLDQLLAARDGHSAP